jgi:dTDP-4-dehydrorhamnose 3,5-epimerase-like enzyme
MASLNPSPTVEFIDKHADDRGEIVSLLEVATAWGSPFDLGWRPRQVQIITSKKGSVRGNHVHKTDTHLCYVVSGLMRYTQASVRAAKGLPGMTSRHVIGPGHGFLTPPGIVHAMEFFEDTVMVVISSNPRGQEEYEADLERIKLV